MVYILMLVTDYYNYLAAIAIIVPEFWNFDFHGNINIHLFSEDHQTFSISISKCADCENLITNPHLFIKFTETID
ncbi:hypothetical protein ACM642_09005 [Chryseobacterium sp. CY353]